MMDLITVKGKLLEMNVYRQRTGIRHLNTQFR